MHDVMHKSMHDVSGNFYFMHFFKIKFMIMHEFMHQ